MLKNKVDILSTMTNSNQNNRLGIVMVIGWQNAIKNVTATRIPRYGRDGRTTSPMLFVGCFHGTEQIHSERRRDEADLRTHDGDNAKVDRRNTKHGQTVS